MCRAGRDQRTLLGPEQDPGLDKQLQWPVLILIELLAGYQINKSGSGSVTQETLTVKSFCLIIETAFNVLDAFLNPEANQFRQTVVPWGVYRAGGEILRHETEDG